MLRIQLTDKLKALNDFVWDRRLNWPRIEEWLSNFEALDPSDQEREELHALFLLSHFTFFNSRLMRALLHSLYRDRIKYPLVAGIRRRLEHTTDVATIEAQFTRELSATRFIGIGNPSESGTHLLYYFRQENSLDTNLFVSPHQCLDAETEVGAAIKDGTITRLVFLDDFCGSGRQAVTYSKEIVTKVKGIAPQLEAQYHVLFATNRGLAKVRAEARFDKPSAVCELDESFKCFADNSRYFRNPPAQIERDYSLAMCKRYGDQIEALSPLGFGGCQLLLGFEHNIPNNTLPIIWSEGTEATKKWSPAFRRYRKGQNW